MAAFFKKEVIKYKNKIKKNLNVDAKIKESWGKMCRFLRHYRKLHLYLLLACPEKSKEEINKIVKQSFKKCNTEAQVKSTTDTITKKYHRISCPDWYTKDAVNERKGAARTPPDDDETESEDEEGEPTKKGEENPADVAEELEEAKGEGKEVANPAKVELAKEETNQVGNPGGIVLPLDTKPKGNSSPVDDDMDTLEEQFTGKRYWPGRSKYINRDGLHGGPPVLLEKTETGYVFQEPSDRWKRRQIRVLTKMSSFVDMLTVCPAADSVHLGFHMNRVTYIRSILCEKDQFGDDGELRPFSLTRNVWTLGSYWKNVMLGDHTRLYY